MGEYLRQALELARTLRDPALLAQSLNRYGNWYMMLEQPGAALRFHREALALFQAAGDQQGLAVTYDLLGVTALMGTDKLAATTYYRRAIALFRELGDLAGLTSALATAALRRVSYYHTTTLPADDDYTAWVGDGEEALELARRIGWRGGEANALVYLALVHGAAGDYSLALARAQAARELAHEIEHPVWAVGASLARGALLLDLLDPAAARGELEQALAAVAGLGAFSRKWPAAPGSPRRSG
jgi:tetratricopeptide (TPR) repeat protein